MTAALLVAFVLVLRPGNSSPPATDGARGGQIAASIRAEPRTFNRFIARDQTTEVLTFLTRTLHLRPTPFTSADVLFSLRALSSSP